MKKISVVALVLALALLVGCGGASGTYEPGTLEGDTYTNEYLGYSFTLPDGWTFATKEELNNMMNAGSELLNDDQKAAAEYAKLATIYDMMATSDMGENIIVMLDNLKLYVGGTATKPEAYVNNLKEQLVAVDADGISYEVSDSYTVNALGKEWIVLSAEISGRGAYQTYSVCRVDNYMVGVIITSTSVVGINDISDYMKAV